MKRLEDTAGNTHKEMNPSKVSIHKNSKSPKKLRNSKFNLNFIKVTNPSELVDLASMTKTKLTHLTNNQLDRQIEQDDEDLKFTSSKNPSQVKSFRKTFYKATSQIINSFSNDF